MPYSQTTWTQLQTSLQNRLDPKGVFYTNSAPYPEITLYLTEAIRAWNVVSLRHRERITFNLDIPPNQWYNLHSHPALTDTITDQDLIAEMQLHLLEPVSPNVWVGSDMFTLDQFTSALQKRRDQFLVETGVEVTRTVGAIPIPANGRFTFGTEVIDVRRISWIGIDGIQRPVWRSDQWGATSNSLDWNFQPGNHPIEYSVNETPPLQCQFIPPPAFPGQVDRITVDSGSILDPTVGVLIGLPEDWCWAIKWGAIADLLRNEEQSRDPARSQYAESRYQEGLELAQFAHMVLSAQINGRPATTLPIQSIDANEPNWANVSGDPKVVVLVDHLLTVWPVPTGPVSVTLDVLRNAPIPVLGAEYVQLGQEEINVVLDYAHHIGAFKQAGAEFQVTQPQFANFIKLAGVYNERLLATSFYNDVANDQVKAEDIRNPRRVERGD